MSSFEFMLSHIGGKKQTQNEMLAHCAQCGKKKLYWNILPPHVFYCQACSYKGNSISLGYRSKVKKVNLTDVQKAVYRYHRLTKKDHRLSEKVLNHFKLKLKKYSTSQGREYHALTLCTAKGQAIKRLIGRSWIALNKADMPDEYWLNVHNLDRKKRRIYVTAGEWDLFSFWENTGINAISPCFGENPRKWKDHTEDLELFQSKEVIILYDNDTKGRQGSLSLAKGIARFVKNKGVRLVDLSVLGLSPGEDLDDFFSEGGVKQRLLEVINNTPFFNQKRDMNQIDFNSLRERNIQCPVHSDSVFSKQIIATLWKIAGYPTAMKESLLRQLAEPDNDEKEIRRSIKAYNQEIITLSWLAIKSEIKRKPPKRNTFGEGEFEIPNKDFFDLLQGVSRKKIIPNKFKPKSLLRTKVAGNKPFLLKGGVYVRTSRRSDSLRLLYRLDKDRQRIRKKSWFHKPVLETYNKNIEKNYNKALLDAFRNAK